MIKYLSFEETREYARKLGIKTALEWRTIKHPLFVYKTPDKTFKNKGWTNWYDFLGTYKNYLSFEETKNYAKSLNLNSSCEWKKIKHPNNIYNNPQIAFKNKGWTNWFDFLGLEKTKKYLKKVSFNEARNYARALNLNSKKEWDKIKHPLYIYSNPADCYKNKGWIDWYDFLGKIKKRYLSFEETREYARTLGLKTAREWQKIKHPKNIYKSPQLTFKNKGWTNWKDFLGNIKKRYLSYEETREYAKSLGVRTAREWQKIKHPKNIYKSPQLTFKNKGWTNWKDFLGNIKKRYLSYEETREYAKSLNINSSEWKKIKHPKNIYKNPQIVFKNKGWTNWFDFLELERREKYTKKVSFNEARNYARGLNLKSKREWDKINHPPYIYSNPQVQYKNKGWIDWYDFLGKIKKYKNITLLSCTLLQGVLK